MQKPNRSFAQKVFAAGLAVTTALWAVSAFAVLPALAVEAHPAGSLVLSGGTVWHISDDGTMRHGIDSLAKFQSHRYSFANVVPANTADLALPDGGLLSWGSGVLFNDGGTVYQVSGGTKHGFTSAANFTGNGFSFANVVSGSLTGLAAGANIDSTSAAHLEGTFGVYSGTVWMITATGRKGVPSPGVLFSYGAKFGEVVTPNAADFPLANEGNATFRTGALVNDGGTLYAVTSTTKRGFPSASCYTGFGFNFSMPVAGSTSGLTAGANYCAADGTPTPTPTTPVSAGTLAVSLASDTPAAATVVKNATRVGFTKVNFTAGASDVIIDSMVIERVGLSVDSNFTDVIILDLSGGVSVGLAKQIGNEKTLGSTHQVTFNDDITVKAGTTQSLLLSGNMAGTLQVGEQVALQLNTVTLGGTATLSGSLPIKGNTMTMNNSLAIGTVTVAAGGQNPSATTQQVGVNDYIVSAVRVTAGSVEDIELQQFRFYQNGTAADGDVANLELVMDSVVIATVVKPVSKEAIFKLATPVVIKKGENKEFALRLDIVDGSSRTVSFDFEKKTDVVALGKTFGYYISPTYPNTTTPFYNANNTTIDVGTLTFSKGVVSSLNVGETSSQVIGAFKTTVQGEPVQVTRLVLNFSVTGTGDGGDITNVVIKDDAAKVVAGPFDGVFQNGMDQATTTDTIIFPVGTKSYTVVANLGSDFSANATIQVQVDEPGTDITAKGTITNQTVTASPTTTVNLDTVTVKAGALLVSTSTTPAAQTAVIGKQDFVFANYVLDASTSGEDVNVTALAVRHNTTTGAETNISNLEVLLDGVAQPPIVQPTSQTGDVSTSTFSFTNPIKILKGASKTLVLRGDINAGAAAETHAFGCLGTQCVTATGGTSGTAVTPTVTESTGQIITLAASGTLTVSDDASSPNAAMLVGGTEKATMGVLSISTGREAVDLTEIFLERTQVNGGNLNDEFTRVYLFDGATQVATGVPTTTTSITFQSLASGTFRVTPGSPKTLTIKVDVGSVSDPSNLSSAIADAGDGINFTVASGSYAGNGVDSGSAITAANKSGTFTGTEFTVYKSVPTFAKVNLSGADSTLVNGTGRPLFRFKLTADAKGGIGFYKAAFAISTSTATVTAFELIEQPGTANEINLTNNATRGVTTVMVVAADAKGGQYAINILFDTGTDGVGNGGEFRQVAAGASKTFELRGTVASAVSGSSVSVVLRGDSAFTSVYPNCAGAAAAGNNPCSSGVQDQDQGDFVWSDLAYASASTTATNTDEWFNGFRVPGLSTTSSAEVVSK